MGSGRQGYELNIFENGRKGVAGSVYYLGNVLQAMYRFILFMRNLSIFFLSVGFSKNQRHLELVWDPGHKVMSLIYLKMGEKAIISEECVAGSVYYLGNVSQPMCGPFFLYKTYRFSRFS